MKRPNSTLPLGLVFCATICLGCGDPAKTSEEVRLQVLDFAGLQKLLASRKGKIVVLDCWSTSCTPCLAEFPGLVALSKKHPTDVACVSLSFDFEGLRGQKADDPAVTQPVLDYLKEQHATFDNVLSSLASEDLAKQLGGAAGRILLPTVLVYDRQGNLARRFDNQQAKDESQHFTYKDVERKVAELLGPNAVNSGP